MPSPASTRARKRWTPFANVGLVLGSLLFIVLIDRVLLAVLGLPIWVWDPALHYRHRPGAVDTWGARFDDKPLVINRHGHHDDDFPQHKPEGERRILNLGDSITMGHGVTREETFSNQLEDILNTAASTATYQVINAGVQGYSTAQERMLFQQSLHFEPDYVFLGFCMNDVTEPLYVNRDYGGAGLDYHRVDQTTSRVLAYLLNETGFGRAIQEVRLRFGDVRHEQEQELTYMVEHLHDDKRLQQSWTRILDDLSAIYRLAEQHNLGITLLIFPHTFQLDTPGMQQPQAMLLDHAAQHGIPVLDFTPIVASWLQAPEVDRANLYLDADHFTVQGHHDVAEELYRYLSLQGFVEDSLTTR